MTVDEDDEKSWNELYSEWSDRAIKAEEEVRELGNELRLAKQLLEKYERRIEALLDIITRDR